jgi:glycosyltransferase involved in cell wall biosynthesis
MTCGQSPIEYTGGIETHVKEISRRLVMKGATVKVLSGSTNCRQPNWVKIGGVRFETFPAIAPFEIFHFSMPLYNALKSDNSEILHAHGYQTFSTIAALLNKKPEQKLFVTIHSAWPQTQLTMLFNKSYRVFLKRLLCKADKIIGVSSTDLRLFGLDPTCSINGSRTSIIPNGVDFAEFATEKPLPRLVPQNCRFILSVGRLEEYKGHNYVIEGFAKLKATRSYDKDLKLVIVGSGRYKDALEELIRHYNLGRDVLLLNNIDRHNLIGLYQKCQMFVLLSRYESQGISVLEAIAAGKPSLVSLTSALTEFVQKGCAMGIAFPPKADEVATMIKDMLTNPERFKPKNSEFYSWSSITKQLQRLYEDVLYR